jgi:beta-N-acetylhexosaminidase
MAGACAAGDIVARAEAAVDAGCDMVLTCNEFDAADELLSRWKPRAQPRLEERAGRMAGQ